MAIHREGEGGKKNQIERDAHESQVKATLQGQKLGLLLIMGTWKCSTDYISCMHAI
jgi:hypothetical protein